jgi:hypothetical protein
VRDNSNIFLALSNSLPGKDAEFNRWYDDYHLREVPEHVLGFLSGIRYKLNPIQRVGARAGRPSPWQYLAVYQLDGSIPPSTIHENVIEQHGRFVGNGGTLDPVHEAWTYAPLRDWVEAPAPSPIPGTQQHLFMAFTNPAAGREAEFNEWYDTYHVPEILASMPGFQAARRYMLHAEQRRAQSPPWRYLTMYQLVGDDIEAIHAGDAAAHESGVLTPAGGVLDRDYAAWIYTQLPAPAGMSSSEPAAAARA